MTAPRFRSTAAFTLRQRRTAPVVDRATFVIFSVNGCRFAAAAESVERVLREVVEGSANPVVHHLGKQIPVIDFRQVLRDATPTASVRTPASVGGMGQRTLVFSVRDVWVAATVDAVYEVATIDAAQVQPVESSTPQGTSGAAGAIDVVRGCFVRHDQDVLVLDMLRVVRAVYEATQRAAEVTRIANSGPAS
jgi:chemotaxis signal transduction protein